MSQGARTRVQIGSATPIRSATPRTIEQAFGPYSRLTVDTPAEKWDRRIGRFCTAIVIAAMVALVVNAAFGGI